MTIKQLKVALTRVGIGHQKDKKKEMQDKLKQWMASTGMPTSHGKCTSGKTMANVESDIKQPTAITATENNCLVIADMKTYSIKILSVRSDGLKISLSTQKSIRISVAPVFGLACRDDMLYAACSDVGEGGIYRCFYQDDNPRPTKILQNGSDGCTQVHGLVSCSSGIVFIDRGSRQVKLFSVAAHDDPVIRVVSGSSKVGDADGICASFYQPTAVCVEANSVFVVDSAVGRVCLIPTLCQW